MIDRLTDRDAFRRLRAEGRRIRGGPLSLVVLPDPGRDRAAVGFAIPRRVGNAVTRNRLRRRLRELHDECGVRYVNLLIHSFWYVPAAMMRASIRRLARDVMPHFDA